MFSKPLIRIGTRGSRLALAQSSQIKSRLEKLYPRLAFQLIVIKTTGDEFQTVELFKKNNIGVFTKKIETMLLKNKIDIAVHSLKDLPTSLPKGLMLAAFPKRADVRDVLISKKRHDLRTLPSGARVGTASLRRRQQLLRLRPDLRVRDLRGNLDTRAEKVLKRGTLDAVVVARAGLLRLRRFLKNSKSIDARQILPAVGQGALAVETRISDKKINRLLKKINDPQTELSVTAERIFLSTLQGGCRVPAGIYSRLSGGQLYLRGGVFSVKDESAVFAEVRGPSARYEKLAKRLAVLLLQNGARGFLKEARP